MPREADPEEVLHLHLMEVAAAAEVRLSSKLERHLTLVLYMPVAAAGAAALEQTASARQQYTLPEFHLEFFLPQMAMTISAQVAAEAAAAETVVPEEALETTHIWEARPAQRVAIMDMQHMQ